MNRRGVNKLVMGKVAISIVLLLLCGEGRSEYVTAAIQHAAWQSQQSKTLCQLLHPIDHFGSAGFLHYSGEPLQFYLQETQFQSIISRASLYVEPSPWHDQPIYRQDYPVFLDGQSPSHFHRLVVFADAAEEMLNSLLQGHYPVFALIRRSQEVRVAVSSINFAESYSDFAECRKALLPFGEKQLERDNLYFAPQSDGLARPITERLRHVSAYMREMPQARAVIASATAVAGTADQKWFGRRARRIVKQLRQYGIASNRIRIENGPYQRNDDNELLLKVFGPDALNRYYFHKGSTRLSYQEKQRLALLAQYIRDNKPRGQITISSHTDSRGRRASNLKVSEERGEAVKNYLIAQGIAGERLRVKAYGESRPIKSNRFPAGRAQNRRVVITFSN